MSNLSKENIFRLFLFAFVFAIPLSQAWSIKLLILAVASSLVLIGNVKWKSALIANGADLLFYFGVLVLGLLYTADISTGLGVLEKNLSFIMVPFLFSRIAVMDKDLSNRIFSVFTAGVVAASCICLGYAIWRDVVEHFPNGYYYDQFTAILDSHPTYMAYYVCFSIIFLLYLVAYEIGSTGKKLLLILGILFLSFILMLTAGRSTFMSMLMMSSFFFLKLLFEPHPFRRKLQGILVTIVLLLIILFQSPYSSKVLPTFPNGRSASLEQIKGDSWERLVLWKSAIKASSNFLLGVGTGDYTRVMNEYYNANGLPQFAESNFNAHNQFIQILFSNGLLGLLALVIIMTRPIYLSVRRQNIFGMLTFFPFLIYGISEVFLGRYQGIIFFVLLHQIFVKYLRQNTEKFSMRSL